jgi:23S rRNA (uracil1939-C5)-methyltransferase
MHTCSIAGRCSGCPRIHDSIADQHRDKTKRFHLALQSAGLPSGCGFQLLSPGEFALRDRVDLTIIKSEIGLFDVDGQNVVDMNACPMMSASLENWFKVFRRSLPPAIKRGSVRLRVSPSGKRGVWLDFANLDIKALLEERHWLENLAKDAVVEIGQRRKILKAIEGQLKLSDPQAEEWFETYLPQKVPLYCHVGSFTQPGLIANKMLIDTVMKEVEVIKSESWLELGSGIGNFTLPLAARAKSVTAIELDALAVQSLRKNARSAKLESRIQIIQKDYRRMMESMDFRAVLCDPSRSGLGGFVDWLGTQPSVDSVIYVSCYLESFASDASRLEHLGFDLQNAWGVDQFPQTTHCEYVARFSRT